MPLVMVKSACLYGTMNTTGPIFVPIQVGYCTVYLQTIGLTPGFTYLVSLDDAGVGFASLGWFIGPQWLDSPPSPRWASRSSWVCPCSIRRRLPLGRRSERPVGLGLGSPSLFSPSGWPCLSLLLVWTGAGAVLLRNLR